MQDVASSARTKLGPYIRPVLIATDQRLLLANAVAATRPQTGHEFTRACELLYSDIESLSFATTGGDHPSAVVTARTADREIRHTMSFWDGKALIAIVKRRTPDDAPENHDMPSSRKSR